MNAEYAACGLTIGHLGERFNFTTPFLHLPTDIVIFEFVCTDGRLKVSLPFYCDVDWCDFEEVCGLLEFTAVF